MKMTPAARMKPRGTKSSGKKPVSVKVSAATLHGLSQIFKQLSDPSRLKILLALGQEEEMHVTALCQMLGQSQPAVSHHLTLLRMTDLVAFRRQGKNNFYRLENGRICGLLEEFFKDVGCSDSAFRLNDFSLAYRRG